MFVMKVPFTMILSLENNENKTISHRILNDLEMMMMIVLIAASKRQIPIRYNGHITGDVTREVKSSLEKKNITE